jgi:DNA-binding CsgD family transcriptional regulator
MSVSNDTISTAAEKVLAARGQLEAVKRLFARSPVPMVIVDGERRYIEVNGPARLAFRLTRDEMRTYRIEDLTPPRLLPTLEDAWARLVQTGCVSGQYEVAGVDGSLLEIVYWATSAVLPGLYLIAFAPSTWPEQELLAEPDEAALSSPPALTPRELEVLTLAADGRSAPEVASELVVSTATVRTHFEHIYEKLGVSGRPAAVARAMRLGLIA